MSEMIDRMISVYFELRCDDCGNNLEVADQETKRGETEIIKVKPCQRCLDDTYKNGQDDAKDVKRF